MKNFKKYIVEKLKLDNNTEFKDYSKVKSIYIQNTPRDFDKMKEYRAKGSKPLTLVHTIKNREKLLARFSVATRIGWKEAARVFGDEIVKRGYYSREEIDKYISDNL